MTSDEIRAHLRGELLPLWIQHGVDRERGGFFNQLTHQLAPVPGGFKRLRVQARQIYTLSRAVLDGADPALLETARFGHAFLVGRFRDERYGGWYLTTTPSGRPLDRRKETYSHAFVILALASFHRASGDSDALRDAFRTLDLLCERARDPREGGYSEWAAEDWRPQPGPRSQNPQMHLLEALLALHEASGEGRCLELAAELVELLRTRLLDAECGCLREHFAASWKRAPGDEGDVVEPGHHFEWAWLLHEYARLASDDSVLAEAAALHDFAAQHGVDPEHGGVYDEIDARGGVRRDSKRLWPQTEYLRGAEWSPRTGSLLLRIADRPAYRPRFDCSNHGACPVCSHRSPAARTPSSWPSRSDRTRPSRTPGGPE